MKAASRLGWAPPRRSDGHRAEDAGAGAVAAARRDAVVVAERAAAAAGAARPGEVVRLPEAAAL
ncbi:hypothetical protein A5656_07290 [Mycobacterium gordonae]|nr:hypothetical protein A5656_07290 [Mycobacterium gordonae]